MGGPCRIAASGIPVPFGPCQCRNGIRHKLVGLCDCPLPLPAMLEAISEASASAIMVEASCALLLFDHLVGANE